MHTNIVFQQDNARAHTARYTQQFLEQSNVQVLPWPANICGITCSGGWTVKTINLITPKILNIPYDGTGMLFLDTFYRLLYLRWDVDVLLYWNPKGGTHIINRSLS
ncbi:transposable element Tcb2 transposase [Elysia marginata]|uniref:Transposable element Tcb2 transposase n=1 Tax=Elysia marginata TaxID=1093978 RepID=A0AAV4IGD8_9GAST|nr:transposable element Tcb2 transposase [Elysia marginata]